jgi:hypothetical protein
MKILKFFEETPGIELGHDMAGHGVIVWRLD